MSCEGRIDEVQRGAADEIPATGGGGRVDARLFSANGHGTRRHGRARCFEPRGVESTVEPAQVRESGREPEEGHAIQAGGMDRDDVADRQAGSGGDDGEIGAVVDHRDLERALGGGDSLGAADGAAEDHGEPSGVRAGSGREFEKERGEPGGDFEQTHGRVLFQMPLQRQSAGEGRFMALRGVAHQQGVGSEGIDPEVHATRCDFEIEQNGWVVRIPLGTVDGAWCQSRVPIANRQEASLGLRPLGGSNQPDGVMDGSRRWRVILGVAVVLGGVFGSLAETGAPEGPLPEASQVVRRMIERSKAVSADTHAPVCHFDKLAVYETLDTDGMVKRSKEKMYLVTIRAGMTSNQLVAVEGRRLLSEESEILSEKERRWRDSYSAGRGGGSTERMDDIVNEKLFSRFEIQCVGREKIRDRRCLVLDLKPKAGDLPTDRLMDRVINLLHGRLWVDESESEIVRAEVRTVGTLRLWGGVLGSLESLQLHVDRERSGFGVWYNRHFEVNLRGRKLFSPMLIRAREIGSRIRLAGGAGEADR